ncbi:uncharacterized protein LOC108321384 isoform X3 [Vigna angularis]|uniref:uncharacterized protein LOC108321384 isoform X3 n=1 Tax=Phaseolus angularis TaxID=3914 RepID=UPI0022B3DB7E|nr:uncharacterized protein LOC108321384 isoform X3 [Vigna angularis]
MLLTCHHHPFLLSATTTNRNHNLSLALSIITSRPLYLTTPNLKLTAHRFNSLTVSADSFPLRFQHVTADSNFDSLLSFLEFSCLLSSAVASSAATVVAASKNDLLAGIGTRAAPFGVTMLVIGVLIGVWIRRRQWRRVCVENGKGGLEVNFLQRIEKLEEDLKSSLTVVRVLSRQLEKLGIRFRVTRKALKDPIAELPLQLLSTVSVLHCHPPRRSHLQHIHQYPLMTAALAQKNSEAARALAVQSDILEQELGEIQHVLLAMQLKHL